MLKLDKAQFTNALQDISRMTGRAMSDLHRETMAGVVATCIRMTPPFEKSHKYDEKLSLQKKVGEKAIERDVRKVFPTEKTIKRDSLEWRVFEMMRSGRGAVAETFARKASGGEVNAVSSPTSELHRGQRNKRGRVFRNAKKFITSESQLLGYLRQKKKMAGYAKSGWAPAARRLGTPKRDVPAWVTRHNARGYVVWRNRGSMRESITIANGVPWLAGTPVAASIIAGAMKSRAIRLKKQVEATRRWYRRKMQGRARVGK